MNHLKLKRSHYERKSARSGHTFDGINPGADGFLEKIVGKE
jgi:hypothetical protein